MLAMGAREQELATRPAGVPGHNPLRQAMWRILELLEQADIDVIVHSHASLADLLGVFSNGPAVNLPKLFLLDNGNFRAVWYGGNGEQLGLQFLGDGIVQWAGFVGADDAMQPKAGRAEVVKLGKLAESLRLAEIVFA